jgi:hypothetical protein
MRRSLNPVLFFEPMFWIRYSVASHYQDFIAIGSEVLSSSHFTTIFAHYLTVLSQVQLLEQNLNSVRARIIEASNVLRSLNDSLRFFPTAPAHTCQPSHLWPLH